MRSIGHSNHRSIKAREEDKVETFMIHIIITKATIKIDTDEIVEIWEFSLAEKVEVGQGVNRTIGEKILGAMLGHIKILEDRIVQENIEVIIGTRITAEREAEVGLGKGHFQGIVKIEGMIEAQEIVDQDLDQEQVPLGKELDAISAESMTTLQKIVPHPRKKVE